MTGQADLSLVAGEAGAPGGFHHARVINGVRLHYVEYGRGPLVILLHGFPEFWYAWRYQIPALADAGFRVIALDQRGYNTSEKPKGVRHYRMQALLDDVLGLIHEAGEQSAMLVGHDWGGAIAWSFAMRYPEAVRKLIVLNAPHPQRFLEELRTLPQLRKSWYVFFFQLPWLPELFMRAGGFAGLENILRRDPVRADTFDAATIGKYKQAIAQPGALTAALAHSDDAARGLFPGQKQQTSRRIDTPTLLIWGVRDRFLDVRLTGGLESWVTNLRLELIPDAGHWVQAEVPERVNALIIQFLRTPKATPTRGTSRASGSQA